MADGCRGHWIAEIAGPRWVLRNGCIAALQAEKDILISAAAVAEALIVWERRNVGEEVANLIEGRQPPRDGSRRPITTGAKRFKRRR